MPSQLHESLLFLFRNRPVLAPELLRDALHVELPRFTGARIDSADLTELQPAESRADLVILLLDGVPIYGIVVEVQLQPDDRKRFAWPAYVTNLRARLELPVCLLVVTADEARADPELAVLSAIAHGKDRDASKAAQIAAAARLATLDLDDDRSRLYLDLVFTSLSKAAQRELRTMDPAKYEYQSDFAKRFVAQGRAEGKAEGKASIVVRQLVRRFGALPPEAANRISAASTDELDAIAERLLTAHSLEEALGPQ